mmetsp:Transcript_27411/g.57200  ORF Transcript_27411/g.57200 Transcript_27411/m.57200 type:complete len:155 (-) Transcript_27411:210-674(-)
MFFFIFRRYGILVPIIVVLVGLAIELSLDKWLGKGYYSNHWWAGGMNLISSGLIMSIFTWIMGPPSSSTNNGAVYAALDLENNNNGEGLLPKANTTTTAGITWPDKDSLYEFVTTPSEIDMFCYVPMNWCALGLMGLGVITVTIDALKFVASLI